MLNHYISNKGKCKGFCFEFTTEGVTTIEKVTNTVISE